MRQLPPPTRRATRRTALAVLAAPALLVALSLAAPLVPSSAEAHGPTRQKVSESVTIDASPEAVWALVGDFPNAAEWLPMVESSSGEGGNEPGATRTLVLGGGAEVREELRKHDDEKMTLSYRIPVATHDVAVLPVNNYSSTLSVVPEGEGSEVTWKGAFYRGYPNNDPPPELSDEAAVEAVTGLYRAGLEHLKKVAEGS